MGNEEIDRAIKILTNQIYAEELEAIEMEKKYQSGELPRPKLIGLKEFLDNQTLEVTSDNKE